MRFDWVSSRRQVYGPDLTVPTNTIYYLCRFMHHIS